MAIDLDQDFDRITLNRIANLEERIKDIFTAQGQFASLTQVQELLAIISTELATLNTIVISLEKRVSILEDIPEVN